MTMTSKRALITGATGFLGRYTVKAFVDSGYEIVALKRKPGELSGASSVQVDFDDVTQCKKLFTISPCNVIIHLASHVDFSPRAEESSFFPTQVLATTILASLARRWNAHFVFSSGVIVHGDKSIIYKDSDIDPTNTYGQMKYLAELILKSAGVRHTILRFGGIFGLAGPRHLGLNVAIRDALENKKVPRIYGAGAGRRNYIYVKDAARAVVTAAEKKIVGTHLIAGKEVLSIAEMLHTLTSTIFIDEDPRIIPNGKSSPDQVIQPSTSFQAGSTFSEALEDILKDGQRA
jgi:UDP-glucose 4-epimerase